MKHDDDVSRVLKNDGVSHTDLERFVNKSTISLDEICESFGDRSWASRIIYNKRFGGVLIRQAPGEGNRLHYHPDADECWVILQGTWEWYIQGEGTKVVKKNDIVIVKEKTWHKITCIGDEPGIRLAITMPDVDHIYED